MIHFSLAILPPPVQPLRGAGQAGCGGGTRCCARRLSGFSSLSTARMGKTFPETRGEKAVFAGILAPSGRARWKSLPFPSGGMGITRWKRWKTCIFTVDCTECKILSKTARLSADRLTGKGEGMGCFLCKRPFFPLPGFASPRRKTRGKTGFRGKSYSHFFPCKTGLNIV